FSASFKALHSLYLAPVSMIHSMISLPCPYSNINYPEQSIMNEQVENFYTYKLHAVEILNKS
uniref:hypothetical protein n=1 Tax=Acinetobacter sp. Res13-Abat-PEC09-P3-02 TaxID=2777949 RepID=UPI001A929844